MSSETWRIDTGEVVHKVVTVRRRAGWVAVSDFGHTVLCSSPRLAVEAYAACNGLIGMILSPGESTRAEMAAQLAAVTAERDALRVDHRKMMDTYDIVTNRAGFLRHIVDHVCRILGARENETTIEAAQRVTHDLATATASVQQLRADVELATAQRDAEACRADNAEAQRDAEAVESDALHDLIAKQAGILTAVADALKGTPPALMTHSHHDLGAVAAATVAQQEPLVVCVDAFRTAAHAAGWHDADATGEHLVAWVRRGALREALAVAQAEPGVPDGATQADFNAAECAVRIAAGIEKLMGGE